MRMSLTCVLGTGKRVTKCALITLATWILAALLLAGFGIGSAAHAQFKVRYPIVDYREFEIEHFADTTFGPAKSGQSNNQRYSNELYPPLGIPNLAVAVETELQAPNSENITYDATAAEAY